MKPRDVFYLIKPLTSRSLQLRLRRPLARWQRYRNRDTWPVDERAAEPPDCFEGWPGGKRFALVLTHDVDTARGQDRCRNLMDLEAGLGFRSSLNIVPERYEVSHALREEIVARGFELGVHGLKHDGKLYRSREEFRRRAARINHYLKEWNAVGFRSPAMHHELDWIHDLNIEYDASTFDTDPFEPQPDGVGTIFPFWVASGDRPGYVELPYTLVQDFTLFILLRETSARIWQTKLRWIAEHGGMALLISHPDYMCFDGAPGNEEYPADLYRGFLEYLRREHEGEFWSPLPAEMARFWRETVRSDAVIRRERSDRGRLSRASS